MANGSKEEELKRYNKLYLTMLLRYKDYIEEEENLNVAQLPTLVTPEASAIVSFANNIKAQYSNYSPEKNFLEAAKRAHSYVCDKIATVTLPIQFWLMPEETLAAEAGDTLDKAILLCSVFIALGNITSKIIISMDDSNRKVGVYCEYGNKLLYFGLDCNVSEFETKEALLKSLGIEKGKDMTAYEFNDKMYVDLI
ncbi:MAG: hypothetical protein ACP5T4_03405 [Candidatus Micrarchaeia archaeon]